VSGTPVWRLRLVRLGPAPSWRACVLDAETGADVSRIFPIRVESQVVAVDAAPADATEVAG